MSTAAETADSPHIDRESLKPVVPSVTASNGWRADELSTIDGCGEVDIATRRSDGTVRAARIVWIVRHGNAVYVRSVNGTTAAWYRGVQTCHEDELSAGRPFGCRLSRQVRPLVQRRRPHHRGRRPRNGPARRPA